MPTSAIIGIFLRGVYGMVKDPADVHAVEGEIWSTIAQSEVVWVQRELTRRNPMTRTSRSLSFTLRRMIFGGCSRCLP